MANQSIRDDLLAYTLNDHSNEALQTKNELPKKTLKSFQNIVSQKTKRLNKT